MPYRIARKFLVKIPTAKQLHDIELRSPQIIGEDAELWKKFIQKEVTHWQKKNYQPRNNANWYEVYMRYKKEEADELKRDREQLQSAMDKIYQEQRGNLSKKVESRFLPKPPKDPYMLANNGGVPISVRNKSGRPGQTIHRSRPISYIGPAATGVKRHVNIVQKAKREAAILSAARQQGRANLPTFRTQIKKAPASMVNEYQRAASEEKKRIPTRPSISPASVSLPPPNSDIEKREARLRAIKASGAKVTPKEPYLAPPQLLDFPASKESAATTIDDGDDELDRLFGEYRERQLTTSAKRKLHGNDSADVYVYQPSPVKPATKRTTDIPPEEWEAQLAKRQSISPPSSRPGSSHGIIGIKNKPKSPPANVPKRYIKRPAPADPFFTPKRPRRA